MARRSDQIKDALRDWMRAPTWHTGNALDERRLERGVRKATELVGSAIAAREFETAIVALWTEKGLATFRAIEVTRKFAERAAEISDRRNANGHRPR